MFLFVGCPSRGASTIPWSKSVSAIHAASLRDRETSGSVGRSRDDQTTPADGKPTRRQRRVAAHSAHQGRVCACVRANATYGVLIPLRQPTFRRCTSTGRSQGLPSSPGQRDSLPLHRLQGQQLPVHEPLFPNKSTQKAHRDLNKRRDSSPSILKYANRARKEPRSAPATTQAPATPPVPAPAPAATRARQPVMPAAGDADAGGSGGPHPATRGRGGCSREGSALRGARAARFRQISTQFAYIGP